MLLQGRFTTPRNGPLRPAAAAPAPLWAASMAAGPCAIGGQRRTRSAAVRRCDCAGKTGTVGVRAGWPRESVIQLPMLRPIEEVRPQVNGVSAAPCRARIMQSPLSMGAVGSWSPASIRSPSCDLTLPPTCCLALQPGTGGVGAIQRADSACSGDGRAGHGLGGWPKERHIPSRGNRGMQESRGTGGEQRQAAPPCGAPARWVAACNRGLHGCKRSTGGDRPFTR